MKQGLQDTVIRGLANSGCYFLCLCEIAELEGACVDVLKAALHSIDNGWCDTRFYMKNPEAVINWLLRDTGKSAVLTIEKKPFPDSYNIREYYNPKTGGTHFVLKDWDSMTGCSTRRSGYVRSYRRVDIKS